MNKNKFRNIKKQKNKKNKKIVEIVIIEKKQQSPYNNKLMLLIPLVFLLFNSSNLFMFVPLIFLCYNWLNKSNKIIPDKEQVVKEKSLIQDKSDIMFILPILLILFILFFVFFYVLFSYLRMKTSLPCIQSCDSIINSVSNNLDISSSVNI